MKVGDVMTRAVLTVPPSASLLDALRLMLTHHVSGLPVVDANDRLVGILTEGDLLRRAETGTARKPQRRLFSFAGPDVDIDAYIRSHGRRIGDLMTRTVVTVGPDSTLAEVVQLMERHRVRRMPVVEGGRMVGLVSRADLLRALAAALETAEATATSDEEARDRIVAELARRAWRSSGRVSVIVSGGIAYLQGVVDDARERDAIRVAAETVVGVHAVRDHLECWDPALGATYNFT